MTLPKGVEKTTAKGRNYYYWNPYRGTSREGERIKLPNLDTNPAAFFKELEFYAKPANAVPIVGSVGHLVQRYRNSEDFKKLSESTQSTYGVHLNRFEIGWGALSYDLPAGAVMALRDSMVDTPGMANHMLSVGRTLWKWGRSIGVQSNPFIGVANLDVGDVGHIPWPEWIVAPLQDSIARPRAHGAARLGDLSAGVRSHSHGARTARARRPVVSTKENEKEAQGILHSPHAGRCAHARSLAGHENRVHCFALESANPAGQCRFLSVFAAWRPIHRNELARAGIVGSRRTMARSFVRAGEPGSPRWCANTSGRLTRKMQTIRPFTGFAAPVFSFGALAVMTSIRFPTTSACRVKWSSATCASATRCTSLPQARRGSGSSKNDRGLDREQSHPHISPRGWPDLQNHPR